MKNLLFKLYKSTFTSKGYWRISKDVMRDPSLTLTSKAIYCDVCAHADESGCSTSSAKSVLENLGLSKDAFYSNIKPLINSGYISKDSTCTNDQFSSTYRIAPIANSGYGFFPASIIERKGLSCKAKGMLG